MRFVLVCLIVLMVSLASGQADTTLGFNCEGLDTLETWQGVRYCLIHPNPEGTTPEKGDKLVVRYTGFLADGTRFDSSGDGVFEFRLQKMEVIRGWDIVFERLHEGESARLFVPYNFAYGRNGRPPRIPRKADLIFDVELIQVVK